MRAGPLVFLALSLWVLRVGGLLVPLAINGSLSSFHQGPMSSHAQRTWTMTWLAFGIAAGWVIGMQRQVLLISRHNPLRVLLFGTTLTTPASIGGMVVVAQMILEYGVCMEIT
ncbi:hypothetical protein EDD36DRAFT_87400 [Exophiala viscosa]|uniref:Uncharacterized protein n=1 Tax=Exophiala viscosa TaxID=2486360 RepID=A0AAN6I949_9EURO|nr:hypothetical protein EDD36DRAFT_87400 [Exophiala viscosa]